MSSSIDGLVSGINTSQIITQLMQVEAAPQNRLKDKVSTAQNAVASYQSVNSKVSALKAAGQSLADLASWRAITAASSSPTVTATAINGSMNTSAGTTTFSVAALAASQITTGVPTTGDADSDGTFTVSIGPPDVVDPDTNILITDNSSKRTSYTINAVTKTAQGIADALNLKGIGVKANVVSTGGAQNILQFSGTKTGSANAFTISGLDQSTTDVAAATNAKLTVGGGSAKGGYDVTSDTNTFTGLLAGVTVTVSKLEDNVTVNAVQDTGGLADKLSAFVNAANSTLTEISNQTAYDASSNSGAPLTGDFAVRNMSQTILSSISTGLTFPDPNDPTGTTKVTIDLKQLGIELDKTGALSFNKDTFVAKYNADPAKFQAAGMAFGANIQTMAGKQVDTLTSVITGRNSEISVFNDQINDWDLRLADKKTQLQKQYSDLEVALGKLKDQQSWLTGQLAGLS